MPVATSTARSGLAPVETALATLRRRRGPDSTRGIVPGLFVPDPGAWISASALVTGEGLDELLDAAKQRWGAGPAAAAALAWRSYTYWLAMPAVLAWMVPGRPRVPLLDPDQVLLRIAVGNGRPLVTLGLRSPRLAVLPDDPLAAEQGVTIVTSDEGLLRELRTSLRDTHLDPLLAQIRARVNLGERTLLGSLASAVAYGLVRGLDEPPDPRTAERLFTALDVADLVVLEGGGTVRRRTCCLAFTLPEPKLCSGCCIPASLTGIG